MAKTWAVKYRFGMGSSTGRGTWTNLFHINTDAALDDPAMAAAIAPLTQGLRAELLSQVTIISATIYDPTKRAAGYDPALVRTIGIGQAGNKGVSGVAEIKQVVLRYKADTGTGRGGHLSLRMAVLDSDVSAGADGGPNANTAPTGAADLAASLNGAIGGGLDMRAYGKRKSGVITDVSIKSWTYVGVGARTATRRKKKHNATTETGALQRFAGAVEEGMGAVANMIAIQAAIKSPAGQAVLAAGRALLPALETAAEVVPALL